MKRVVDVLYGLKGYPNQERFDDFKTDLFEEDVPVPILVDTINEGTTGSGVTIDGVLLKDGTITTTAPIIRSLDPAVTAAGTTQATAVFTLTEEINIITAGAANTGVQLPVAVVGLSITVYNDTASVKKIYANDSTSQTIDDLGATAAVVMQPEDVVTFYCYTIIKWQSDFETIDTYNALSVNNALATGSSLAVTDTGIFTGTAGIVKITADAITTGDMLNLDAGGGGMTGDGKFINCNDDDVDYFAVSAHGATTITSDAVEANNAYVPLTISKDLTHATAVVVAQTNSALSVAQVSATTAAGVGTVMTVANIMSALAMTNSTAVASADVYSGTVLSLAYSATTTTTGTATNSATGFLLDYNVSETAGTLSNTSFNVMFIDFDAAGTPAFANGTYNMLLIDVDTASSLDATATAILNGVYVDMSGTTVTDAQLSLFGVNVLMPTFGTSAQIGARISDGTRIVDLVNGTNAASLTGNVLITGTGVTAGNILEINATALTTGSLFDYLDITTKTEGYLFNGSVTTSVLTSNFLADDFLCSCAHDGVGNDTLRMIRRSWTGALPNGTLAADFVIAEFSFSGTAGTAASKSGAITGVKIDLGSATVNDSALSVYGLYIDPTVTNTSSAGLYGIYMPGGGTPYIPLQVGVKASASGSGLKLSGSGDNSAGVQLYFDDGGASVAGEVVTPIRSRMLITVAQTSGTTVCGSFSQMVSLGTTGSTKALTTGALRAAYIFNQVGALTMTSAAEVSGINQATTVAGNTTVDTDSRFTGIDINIRGAGTITPAGSGVVSGLYIRSSETAQWTTGIKLADSAAPTAIAIGTATTGISTSGTMTNLIDVTAAATLTNLFKFDAVAGVLVASDVDPNETPSSGGLGADGVITFLIGGDTCYIPYFTALHNL